MIKIESKIPKQIRLFSKFTETIKLLTLRVVVKNVRRCKLWLNTWNTIIKKKKKRNNSHEMELPYKHRPITK